MNRINLRAQEGMTMIAVMIIMLVATVIASASLAAAEADLPFAGESQQRKQAYAAAEAGVEYYLYQLTQDNDYWTKCSTVPAPAPVNPRWRTGGVDPRKWRNLNGTKSDYTIELMPLKGVSQCVNGSAHTTMLDPATGTFRIRTTGRAGDVERSIVTSFRRTSFLDFLYFTDFETLDPEAYTGSGTGVGSPSWANANCRNWRQFRNPSCTNIQFISADANRGPFHSNDSILACGNYTLGRTKADRIEISQPNGIIQPGGSGACDVAAPNMKGTLYNPADTLTMPTSNAKLKDEAIDNGIVFTGTTHITFKGNVMDVWDQNGVYYPNMAMPNNGVIYVQDGPGCTGVQSPLRQMYDEPKGCANVTVTGTYSKNLTIGSEKDIIVGPRLDPITKAPTSSNGDLLRSGDVVMGLIANNFVRVQHAVNRADRTSTGCESNRKAPDGNWVHNIRIEAAILSLNHSFIADNYACGEKLGTLTVYGAIAQRFRGPVGIVGARGFIKDYNYDDRLRYRSPPYFLDPVSAAWGVVRSNEQVPAANKAGT